MVTLIVFVVLLATLGTAVYLGRTVDSRDSEYGLGRVIDPSVHPVGR
jgi:hypothetical protein